MNSKKRKKSEEQEDMEIENTREEQTNQS